MTSPETLGYSELLSKKEIAERTGRVNGVIDFTHPVNQVLVTFFKNKIEGLLINGELNLDDVDLLVSIINPQYVTTNDTLHVTRNDTATVKLEWPIKRIFETNKYPSDRTDRLPLDRISHTFIYGNKAKYPFRAHFLATLLAFYNPMVTNVEYYAKLLTVSLGHLISTYYEPNTLVGGLGDLWYSGTFKTYYCNAPTSVTPKGLIRITRNYLTWVAKHYSLSWCNIEYNPTKPFLYGYASALATDTSLTDTDTLKTITARIDKAIYRYLAGGMVNAVVWDEDLLTNIKQDMIKSKFLRNVFIGNEYQVDCVNHTYANIYASLIQNNYSHILS